MPPFYQPGRLAPAPTDMPNKPSHHRRPKPPRFLQTAADILGYTPSHLPNSQLLYQSVTMLPQPYEGFPQWAQKAAETYIPDSLLDVAEATTGAPHTLCSFPQTIPEYKDRLSHPPPVGRRRELSEAPAKFPRTDLPGYHLSPPPISFPATYTFPYNTAIQSLKVVHPAPRRPIQLSDVRGPLLSPDALEQSFYLPTPVATLPHPWLVTSNDIRSIEPTVHKDGRRSPLHKAAAPHQSYCSPSTEHTGKCNYNNIEVLTRAGELDTFNLGDYAKFLRQRFGCSVSYKWLKGAVRPRNRYVHPDLLTESEKALYQTRVRSWIAGNTGLTIHEKMYQAFVAIDVRNAQQCTMPLVWFVLLLRKALIMSPCAQQLGILPCLGAQNLDPCHPLFHFPALKDAIREFLGSMNPENISRGFHSSVGTRQHVADVCSKGHLRIVLSETPCSTLHLQPLRPRPHLRPDMVSYTDEFRESIKRLFADASVVEYMFLARILHLRFGDLSN